MKKLSLILLSSLVLGACSLPFGILKKAVLDVKSDPVSTVYINEEHAGSTPFYKDDLKPGTYTIKLVQESDPEITWQTKVTLKPQLLTNITRRFGSTPDTSSDFTISLEPNSRSDQTSITVITLPDSAVVKLDGQPIGFSIIDLDDVKEGDHQIDIGSPGFQQLSIPIKAVTGYNLIISAHLAKDRGLSLDPTPTPATQSAVTSPSPSPFPNSTPTPRPTNATSSATPDKPYVTITDTPTGWLRVRSEPSGLTDNEVGKVTVGESYSFIESNQVGWYKIEYSPSKQGWISAQYAKLVN